MTAALYETLKLLAQGLSNAQIGEHLEISESAATDRVRRLLVLFAVPGRTQLVTKCYRERIV